MPIHTRIYAGDAIAFGGQPAIDGLILAGYSSVIVWSVHVDWDGTLFLNDTKIVSSGVYKETDPMDLPSRLARLRKTGVEIIFSVGAGGTHDFQSIEKLLEGGVPGPGNPLYDNFKALKDAMVSAEGGDIDAVDFDNEDNMKTDVMVNFGLMLAKIGFSSVTLCPYDGIGVWTDTFRQLREQRGKGFVSAIHLQCYSGGANNSPKPWADIIANEGGGSLLIPGLATNQAQPGPWWYCPPSGGPCKPGGSVVKTPNFAMFGGGDWSRMLRRANYANAELAMQKANTAYSFFFYCREFVNLGPGKVFQAGDAVYFSGLPQWGSAPQCDTYSLSTNCSNIYNNNGACPADLRSQYARWKLELPLDGGFIWLYDSVVSCLLAGCCGGTGQKPTTTAKDYRAAITAGLS